MAAANTLARDRFTACLPYILKEEGGNDDDPQDPGGRTSRGIIQRVYDAFRKREGLSQRDVWKASDDEVRQIYREQYWEPRCPKMPAGVDLLFFDMAVNTGPSQAAKHLQRALGVKADGAIGIVTMTTLSNADPKIVIAKASSNRRAFYRVLKTFPRFGKGWISRVDRIEKAALSQI